MLLGQGWLLARCASPAGTSHRLPLQKAGVMRARRHFSHVLDLLSKDAIMRGQLKAGNRRWEIANKLCAALPGGGISQ